MALSGIERIFVGETFPGAYVSATSGYSGDTNAGAWTAGTSATQLDAADLVAGEIALIDPDTRLGIVLGAAGTVPPRIQIAVYDPYVGLKLSPIITRADVYATDIEAYRAETPLAYRIGTWSALSVGDEYNLRIIRRGDTEFGTSLKPLVIGYRIATTTLATELTAFALKINQELAFTYGGATNVPIVALATATTLLLVAAPVRADFTGVINMSLYTFDLYLDSSYDQSTDTTYNEGWSALNTAVITKGSITGFTWTGSTYTGATFSTAMPLLGMGMPYLIRSDINEYDQGNQGNLYRRSHGFPTVNDPVVTASTYDRLVIHFKQKYERVGEPNQGAYDSRIEVYMLVANTAFLNLVQDAINN
jgi:hypothetical protein